VGRGAEVIARAPLGQIPVWVRAGALVLSYPAEHVARGLGDTPEAERPIVATLWGSPDSGRATKGLVDGLIVRWSEREGWSCSDPDREVGFRIIEA
jgi:hypothetical protein